MNQLERPAKAPLPWPPKKLPKDFPLTVHSRGYVKSGIGWICGKKTPEEALAIYHEKAKRKLSGRPPPVRLATGDRQTVNQLAERYAAVRLADANAGDIRISSYRKIETAMAELLDHVVGADVPNIGGTGVASTEVADLVPDHFRDFGQALRRDRGDAYASRTARLVIGLLKYAADEDWITRPVKVGRWFRQLAWAKRDAFKSTPPAVADVAKMLGWLDGRIAFLEVRKARSRGNRTNTAPHRQFRAAMLLALNGGYGSSELAQLPRAVVDLDGGCIDFRRGKTGEAHYVPLWPRTVEALRAVVADAERLRPGDDLLFRTREGKPWNSETRRLGEDGEVAWINTNDNFTQWFGKVARAVGVKRPMHGFYSLKDLHCSLADDSNDIHASYRLAGHALPSKGRDPYVTVSVERLRKLVGYIEHRIFGEPGGEAAGAKAKGAGAKAKVATAKRATAIGARTNGASGTGSGGAAKGPVRTRAGRRRAEPSSS